MHLCMYYMYLQNVIFACPYLSYFVCDSIFFGANGDMPAIKTLQLFGFHRIRDQHYSDFPAHFGPKFQF